LQHIEETGECAGIDSQDSVADDVVGYTGKLHDDHAHILHPLGDFDLEELFYRHVPAHVIDGRGAIVEAVGKRCDLVVRAVFGDFLKGTMDVTNGGYATNDTFAIDLEDILEHPMCGGVGRP